MRDGFWCARAPSTLVAIVIPYSGCWAARASVKSAIISACMVRRVGFEGQDVVPTPLHNLLDNRRLTAHRVNRDSRIMQIQQIEVQRNDADLIRLVIDRQLPQPHPLCSADECRFLPTQPSISSITTPIAMMLSSSAIFGAIHVRVCDGAKIRANGTITQHMMKDEGSQSFVLHCQITRG